MRRGTVEVRRMAARCSVRALVGWANNGRSGDRSVTYREVITSVN